MLKRPLLSGNMLNQYLNVVIVCPLTSKVKNYKGNVVLEPDEMNNLKKPSEILLFPIRSVAKERLKKKIGNVSHSVIEELKVSLNEILRY